MKVEEVMEKYDKKVPFPISPVKLLAAGYDPRGYLSDLADDLSLCDDYYKPGPQRVIRAVKQLKSSL